MKKENRMGRWLTVLDSGGEVYGPTYALLSSSPGKLYAEKSDLQKEEEGEVRSARP